jgi:hypothetical protein
MTIGNRLTLIGVRHHSPACARLVRREIERIRPAFVLIEGPSDFNPYIDDLRRGHALPIAIFSFHSSPKGTHASHTPFCDYSPEWQALLAADAIGATALFCDLPAWHPDFGDRANRYADPHRLLAHADAATQALARALGADGQDALWDVLAEQADETALSERLDAYFALLRRDGAADPAEAGREAFMGRYAAWALSQAAGRSVVLVCGGWHVGAIRQIALSADGTAPMSPSPNEGAVSGSYLVPYSYKRLDRFVGYAAGMPSPGYYGEVHASGLEAAADWAMDKVSQSLREAGQVVSTADRIAWYAHAQALARVRGHTATLRADVLDSALAALLKDALEAAPAWTQPGTVTQDSDAFVLAMLRALSGEREGRLAEGTRHPPLLADVGQRLNDAGLVPARRLRRIEIDWHDPSDRARAHILNQLGILGAPGVTRLAGPMHADASVLTEAFDIIAHRDWLAALIEASRYGGTLPMAASGRLAERIAQSGGDLDALAAAASEALFANLLDLAPDLVASLQAGAAVSHDIAALGRAGRRIERIYRFGEVFGTASHAGLGTLAETIFARALWLIEGVHNPDEASHSIDAVLACRDLARECRDLVLDRAGALSTFARLLDAAPPALAGAALGYLVACGNEDAASPKVAARVRRFGRPDHLGDFLTGLFALAREEMGSRDEPFGAVDTLVGDWSDDDFLRALPAMRLAFAWFPPRERERLAQTLLRRKGLSQTQAAAEALAWMRQKAPILDQAAARALEARVAARLSQCGIL